MAGQNAGFIGNGFVDIGNNWKSNALNSSPFAEDFEATERAKIPNLLSIGYISMRGSFFPLCASFLVKPKSRCHKQMYNLWDRITYFSLKNRGGLRTREVWKYEAFTTFGGSGLFRAQNLRSLIGFVRMPLA
jgi:hypothetical protein